MYSKNFEVIIPFIEQLIGMQGSIKITLNNFEMKLDNKSVVGDALESFVIEYLKTKVCNHYTNNVIISKNLGTQTFPDAYITVNGNTTYLEIKTFDIDAGANFDLGNFESYVSSLPNDPEMLYADYLVIGYSLENGILSIQNVWYKKIWELCCASTEWALRMQVKRGTIYNIRPCNLTENSKFQPFKTKYDFINAIQSVLNQYNKTSGHYTDWKDKIKF